MASETDTQQVAKGLQECCPFGIFAAFAGFVSLIGLMKTTKARRKH